MPIFYVELTYDNDYKSMMIIDLNKKSETISIGDSFAHTALLNPNDFYLGDNIFTIRLCLGGEKI